jgi:hypothetical protein
LKIHGLIPLQFLAALTVLTADGERRKQRIYSNFDDFNRLLLADYLVGT